jgi:hypothetical protein
LECIDRRAKRAFDASVEPTEARKFGEHGAVPRSNFSAESIHGLAWASQWIPAMFRLL